MLKAKGWSDLLDFRGTKNSCRKGQHLRITPSHRDFLLLTLRRFLNRADAKAIRSTGTRAIISSTVRLPSLPVAPVRTNMSSPYKSLDSIAAHRTRYKVPDLLSNQPGWQCRDRGQILETPQGDPGWKETQSEIAVTFTAFASQRMAKSMDNIFRCVAQLSEEQMRHRSGDHENSIINLLVHLQGNVRQWILSGIASRPDDRDRGAEFALKMKSIGTDALAALNATVAEARTVIEGLSLTRLAETSAGPLTGVQAIEGVKPVHLMQMSATQPEKTALSETVLVGVAHIFSHFEYHTGQIVLLAKQMVGHALDLTTPSQHTRTASSSVRLTIIYVL